jgi:hypothetical protein
MELHCFMHETHFAMIKTTLVPSAIRTSVSPATVASATVAANDTASYPITGFKVEQKILDLDASNSINAGGFVNGESNVKRFQSRYQVTLFSNKFESVPGANGKTINKRLGYGYGFVLDVSNIKTKVNFNYAIIAASAALDYAKADFELVINGVRDPTLTGLIPVSGSYSSEIYSKLIEFIKKAKQHLSSTPVNALYPIEILAPQNIKLESSDTESLYFGMKRVAEGKSLKDSIDMIRKNGLKKNENVVQFVYRYFDIPDAYTAPTGPQKQSASKWIDGKFNKVKEVDDKGTWVAIEPAVIDGKFAVLSGTPQAETYKPHAIPAEWKTGSKTIRYTSSEVSLDFSSNLKLSALVDTSAKFNTQTMTKELTMYMDVSKGAAPGSKVIETRYGIGVRITLRITQVEFGTKLNYGVIGAVSELGHANVEYEISGMGIVDTSILKDLPGPQVISQNTMKDIETAFEAIQQKLAAMDVTMLEPQPFMIRVPEASEVDPTMDAQAVVFAYKKMADQETLKDAINQASAIGIKQEVIKTVYKKLGVTDVSARISRDIRKAAEAWLEV